MGPRPCVFPTSVTRNEIMSIPPEVELRLSGDLFGGNPRGLLAHLGLYGRPMGDNRWMVRPNEEKSFFRGFDLAAKQVRPVRASILEILPRPRPTPGCENGCRGRHALPPRRQRLSRGSRVHPRTGRSDAWTVPAKACSPKATAPPARGTERLQPGTTVLVGRQHSTGRCPCCAAVWITDDEHGWTCLDTGKLICTHAT